MMKYCFLFVKMIIMMIMLMMRDLAESKRKREEVHGQIFCRDLQSSKMQANNLLWPGGFGDDGDKRKY